MITATKDYAISTFKLMGEKFVVLKQEYLDELRILMASVITGEAMLKKGQTRSFNDFIQSVHKKRK